MALRFRVVVLLPELSDHSEDEGVLWGDGSFHEARTVGSDRADQEAEILCILAVFLGPFSRRERIAAVVGVEFLEFFLTRYRERMIESPLDPVPLRPCLQSPHRNDKIKRFARSADDHADILAFAVVDATAGASRESSDRGLVIDFPHVHASVLRHDATGHGVRSELSEERTHVVERRAYRGKFLVEIERGRLVEGSLPSQL